MHALVWSGTHLSFVDLHPPNFTGTIAAATNGTAHAGWGVGPSTGGQLHALAWPATSASVIDLHQFLPSSYTYSVALGIDAAGNIVGYAGTGTIWDYPSTSRAFVWKPTGTTGG